MHQEYLFESSSDTKTHSDVWNAQTGFYNNRNHGSCCIFVIDVQHLGHGTETIKQLDFFEVLEDIWLLNKRLIYTPKNEKVALKLNI